MVDIFSPLAIGNFEVKNRLAMAPLGTHFATPGGYVSQKQIDYYVARAKGGFGLLTVECNWISDRGKKTHPQEGGILNIGDDSHILNLAGLCRAMKEANEDIRCALQLGHVGKYGPNFPLAPSAINPPLHNPAAQLQEMDRKEIDSTIEEFIRAAWRVKMAGFDAVTLHGAHGYLIQQFISPYSNKRTDEYGRDRLLFAKKIIQGIHQRVGGELAIIMRISGDEYLDELGLEGYKIEDMKKMAPELVDAGLDALDISASVVETAPLWCAPPAYIPRGFILHLAKEIKKVAKVPVFGVGRVNTPEFARKMIEEEWCDMVSLGRAHLADPDFPRKMKEHREEDIRRCIGCNTCLVALAGGRQMECAVNPSLGREKEYEIRPAKISRRKRIMVIGGGPAGLEAAWTLGLRGHEVALYEKRDQLGGQLRIASIPPGKEEVNLLTEFLISQARKFKVNLFLNTELTEDLIRKESPDVIVVAGGGVPFKPEIKGLEKGRVFFAEEVLWGYVPLSELGNRVVIVGGELVACEFAHYLLQQGKKIWITNIEPDIAIKIEPATRMILLKAFNSKGAVLLPGVQYREIVPEGIYLINQAGHEEFLEADSILLAAGSLPNQRIIDQAKGKTKEQLYIIGDNFQPRNIKSAVHDGARTGRQI